MYACGMHPLVQEAAWAPGSTPAHLPGSYNRCQWLGAISNLGTLHNVGNCVNLREFDSHHTLSSSQCLLQYGEPLALLFGLCLVVNVQNLGLPKLHTTDCPRGTKSWGCDEIIPSQIFPSQNCPQADQQMHCSSCVASFLDGMPPTRVYHWFGSNSCCAHSPDDDDDLKGKTLDECIVGLEWHSYTLLERHAVLSRHDVDTFWQARGSLMYDAVAPYIDEPWIPGNRRCHFLQR